VVLITAGAPENSRKTCSPGNPAPGGNPEPTSQDAKPWVQPGVHLPVYITNVGGETRVKPRVWRPEMWAKASTGRRHF
jgi:hypothetical protein